MDNVLGSEALEGDAQLFENTAPYKKHSVWEDRKLFYFDRHTAYNVVRFFESEIVHIKGPLAGQKLKLERWQKRFLRRLYGWKRRDDGTRRYRTAFLFLPRKQGKALALDTLIPAPSGWKTMANLKVGQYVYSEKGIPTKILAATEILENRPCYEIEFSDGAKIVCDENHEWLVEDRFSTTSGVLTTKQMEGYCYEGLRFFIYCPEADEASSRYVSIFSITPVESVPVRCIQVDNPTSLYLASKNFIPTHNSFLGAGMALYGLLADKEAGAECVSAAVDRDQARVIFDVAREIVIRSPRLSKICTVYAKTIVVHRTTSKYSALSADVENKHGSNPSTIIFDELHTQPNGNLIEVLETGTGARAQPLLAFFTTAGHDKNSVCYEYYVKAKAVEKEPWRDPTFLSVIYEAIDDKENPDSWKDPAVWKKANPNYGISINPVNFELAFRKALENKRLENGFKRLHLNMWTEQDERWLTMDQWAEGATPWFGDDFLEDMTCVGGLDLSSKSDLTALVLVFRDGEGIHYVKPYFWLPMANIIKKEKRDNVPYREWAKQGLIHLLEGEIIDYSYVRKFINKLSEKFRIYQIGYDPHRAEQLSVQLEQDGFTMIEVRQGFAKLSEPSKELESLLEAGKLKHNGHPILHWMAGNVGVLTNSTGEIRPDKKREKQRIDGISALINALSRLIVYNGKRKSKYEDEGLETTE